MTRNPPNIWVGPNDLGHGLSGSNLSVRQVWASNWANFVDLLEFFFNSIFMGLLFTKIYIFLTLSNGPIFTSFISIWTFKLSLYVCLLHHLFQIGPSSSACMPLHNFESFWPSSHISPNLIFLVPTYK